MTTIDFNEFAIAVRASPSTNDHEVRFFGDGVDLIDRFWGDMIGLDPDDVLIEPCMLRPGESSHKATIARCDCGVVGCDSTEVEVRAVENSVLWADDDRILRFPAKKYLAELGRAQADTTWEPPDRVAARLLRSRIDRIRLAEHGFTFMWASGRIAPHTFTVSLRVESTTEQLLISIPWSNQSPEEISNEALHRLSRRRIE